MSEYLDRFQKILSNLPQPGSDSLDWSSLQNLVQEGKSKVEELSALAKISLSVSRCEAELEKLFVQIGQQTYENRKDNPPCGMDALFEQTSSLQKDLNLLRCEAEAIKKSVAGTEEDIHGDSTVAEIIPFGSSQDSSN